VTVVPIPGTSAVLAALSASGLDPSRFLFEGFLPRGAGEQRKVLALLRPLPHTLVFYEAPTRLARTLAALRETLGDRAAVVGREVTKKFEQFVRGPLSEVEVHFRDHAARGECVIVVAGASDSEQEPDEIPVDDRLSALLIAGTSVRDAARAVAAESGRPRNEVYDRARTLAEALRSQE
jgi:16S rRNA (cytidine1402-2'-O)-methyltransferase